MYLELFAHAANQILLLWAVLHVVASVLCGLLLAGPSRIPILWALLVSVVLPGAGPLVLGIIAVVRSRTDAAEPVQERTDAVVFGVREADRPAVITPAPASESRPPGWPPPPQPVVEAGVRPTPRAPRGVHRVTDLTAAVCLALLTVGVVVAWFLRWAEIRVDEITAGVTPWGAGLWPGLLLLVAALGTAVWLARARTSWGASLLVAIVSTQILFASGAVYLSVQGAAAGLRSAAASNGEIGDLIPQEALQEFGVAEELDLEGIALPSVSLSVAPGLWVAVVVGIGLLLWAVWETISLVRQRNRRASGEGTTQ